jgi:hypothetical protein
MMNDLYQTEVKLRPTPKGHFVGGRGLRLLPPLRKKRKLAMPRKLFLKKNYCTYKERHALHRVAA